MRYSDYLEYPLPANPRRIVWHWTGGGPKANSIDKKHYHLVFNQDGTVSKGNNSIASNMRSIRGGAYAAHTGGLNSYSIGFSCAGMWWNAKTKKIEYYLNELQVEKMLRMTAAACYLYGLNPRDPAHCHTHAEAWRIHRVKGKTNDTKWDIDELKFLPGLDKVQVGDWLRDQTGLYYDEMVREPSLALAETVWEFPPK